MAWFILETYGTIYRKYVVEAIDENAAFDNWDSNDDDSYIGREYGRGQGYNLSMPFETREAALADPAAEVDE